MDLADTRLACAQQGRGLLAASVYGGGDWRSGRAPGGIVLALRRGDTVCASEQRVMAVSGGTEGWWRPAPEAGQRAPDDPAAWLPPARGGSTSATAGPLGRRP